MRFTLLILSLVAAVLVAVAVEGHDTGTAQTEQDVGLEATLSGEAQVPTPVSTNASGSLTATLNAARTELSFELAVSDLAGVTQVHIHCGGANENGSIAVFLYGLADPIDADGVLSTGTLTAADLGGEACGASFSAFADALLNGQTYVNAHTVTNPAGEIRGQVLQAQAPVQEAQPAAAPSAGGAPPASGDGTSTWTYIVIAASALALLGGGTLALAFQRKR